MLGLAAFLAGMMQQADVPPVPGLCTSPMPTNADAPGCYQTNELDLTGAPATLFWHIYEVRSAAEGKAEAARHRWGAVAQAHGRTWLYLLGDAQEHATIGSARATIGPLSVPAGGPVTAHFSEAVFPPGMRTRVHAHPGPEAFYVVSGEQCMETPTDRHVIPAGGTYIVPSGPHLQAAPKGRRNLVLILAPTGQPFVQPRRDWQPSGFCDR